LIDQYVGDELWVWGDNTSGRLGTNNTLNRSTPVTTFAGGTNWKQVSAGYFPTAAIKTDGTLWTWGRNDTAALGNNQVANVSTPITTFAGGTNWKQVSAGSRHTAAIKTDGTLWVWGNGSGGRLGNASTVDVRTPVTTFSGGIDWKQVSCGNHTAAIKTDGTLWTWGIGTYGRLGNGVTTGNISTPITTFAGGTNWKQVQCGYAHAAAIKTDGTLWSWGRNNPGALGTNDITNRSTPVTTFAGGTNWKQVSAGGFHIAAIKTDGTLWTWGYNVTGTLGNNQVANVSTPITTFAGGTNWKQVSAGNRHTAAIKTDGTLWVWGDGGSARLGTNNITNRSTPVTTFAGGTNWKQVSAGGGSHMAAVFSGTTPDLPIS
jgi:alpha-tubulin suppressor-like RCC1 family protein